MVSWSGRPFLRLVVVGLVTAAVATVLDALVLDGGGALRSGFPQAVIATAPFLLSPLRKRNEEGLRAAQDRTGLIAVVVLGAVVVGYGIVRIAHGPSVGQQILSGVVVVLGMVCVVLAVRLLTWARATDTIGPAAVED